MIGRASGSFMRRWCKQTVLITDPPVDSPAAMVLLSRFYSSLDPTIFRESRMSRLRTRWMHEQMKTPDSKGGLTCAICGRKGLNPFTKNKHKLATLDHIHELKRGGAWYDTANFRVACSQCNNARNFTT